MTFALPGSPQSRFFRPPAAWVLASCLLGLSVSALGQSAVPSEGIAKEGSQDRQDFSAAEKLLLMSDQLRSIKPPLKLVYSFKHEGTLEAGFDDQVTLSLKAKPGQQGCCAAEAQFLSGERKVTLPQIDEATGNPVTLYFLEHDIREMKRLTKGSTTYFRKRIRMALYQDAVVAPVSFSYQGKSVEGQQIVLEPYRDDPNRMRFENLVRKQYVFTLSDAVPGTLAAIRTVIRPAQGDAAVLREDLVLRGVEPPVMPAIKPYPPAAPSAGASKPN